MARQYGQDTESAKSASEEVSKIREGDAVLQGKVEKVIAIGALAIGFIFFMVKIFGAVGDGRTAADYRARTEQYRQLYASATTATSTDVTGETGESTPSETTISENETGETGTTGETSATSTPVVGEDTVVRNYLVHNASAAAEAVAAEQNRLISVAASGQSSYDSLTMSQEVLDTYFDVNNLNNTNADKAWSWRFISGDVDVVWVCGTNYNFEDSYIEGSTGGPNPPLSVSNPSSMTIVWRCYKVGDEIAQTRLLGYVTAIYNSPTQVYPNKPDGYFTDVQFHGLTGWGATEADNAEHNGDNPTPSGQAPAAVSDCGDFDDGLGDTPPDTPPITSETTTSETETTIEVTEPSTTTVPVEQQVPANGIPNSGSEGN